MGRQMEVTGDMDGDGHPDLLIIGGRSDTPGCTGSGAIHDRMMELGNNSNLLTWEGIGHTPFVSSNAYMDETIEFSANFIHDLACDASFMLGDLNFDSTLNILDIILLVNVILDPSQSSDQIMETGDINGDGILNILDIISLVNLILSSP